MLLAIDVGNTGMGLGLFDGDKLRVSWRMATSISRMPDEYAALLLPLLKTRRIQNTDITDVCICSVGTSMVGNSGGFVRYAIFDIKPLVVSAGTKTGVRIRMDNPREVGPTGLSIRRPRAIFMGALDHCRPGTATTFDTVSKDGEYTGGAIAPGIQTAAEALFARTAMLHGSRWPARAKPSAPILSPPCSPVSFSAMVSLIEGMVARIQKELPEKARVVLTGVIRISFAKETSVFDEINPNLIFVGLKLVLCMNKT